MAAFDVTMARTFQDPRSPLYWDTIGGCCVTPPVGHVLTHESGTRGRVMGAKTTAQRSLHKSRWEEAWCLGGTRPLAAHVQLPGQRRLIGMPMPRQAVVFGTGHLNVAELHDELRWRTHIAEPVAAAIGPLQPEEGTAGERAALSDRQETSAAWNMAKLMLPADYPLPANWHASAMRRHFKHLVAQVKKLDTSPLPAGHLRATPRGHLADAVLTVLSLPKRISTSRDMDESFFFRSYVLPRDHVSELAFRLSMEEGRQGRPMATSEAALLAPWASPTRCSQIIAEYLREGA